jgi:hypothetical protein
LEKFKKTFRRVKCDKKEAKSEQASQIIGNVIAESYVNKSSCMGVDNLWSPTLLYNKSYRLSIKEYGIAEGSGI